MFKFFENLIAPYAPYQENDTPPQKLWPFIWSFCGPFKAIFALAAVMSLVVAAIEISLIYYMGRVVDFMQASPQQVWADHRTELIVIALALLTIRPLIQALDVGFLNNAILPNFGALLRWRAHKHVLRQSVGWFENDFAGRIANRIMQTPPAMGEVIFQIFDAISFSVAYVIGAFVLLSASDPRLMFPLLFWLVLYGFLVFWAIKRITPASQAAADARSNVTGRVVDAYTNIHSVKMFAHHEQELNYAKEAIEENRSCFQREMRIFSIMDIILVWLNGFLIVAVVGWAIMLWMQGSASTGIVAAAAALTLRLNGMSGWIMWSLSTLFRELGVVREGMQTIAQPIALLDAPKAPPLHITQGAITLENLSHHYGQKTGGLDKLNLHIPAGQKVGLVGRSGAGKTTLVKLLMRFYDPDAGRILMDDQEISKITQDSLRLNIGMVQQDSALLHRSIRDNLLYGRPDASQEEIEEAAKRAHAHTFIQSLCDQEGRKGYDAQVGERGVKLSGGQRQRIALGRVILKDAPILLLDEATSALDSEVEAKIQSTLYDMMEDKTVIAIAHPLSTIAQMDRIIVLDGGQIVQDGDHANLLAQEGLYAQFWTRQSGGFIQTD